MNCNMLCCVYVLKEAYDLARLDFGGISGNSDHLSCLSGASLEERDRETREEQSPECVSLPRA